LESHLLSPWPVRLMLIRERSVWIAERSAFSAGSKFRAASG